MKQINPIHTHEEWNKVRILANTWYRQTDWYIPTNVYYVILVIGFIGAIVSKEHRQSIGIFIAIVGAQLYAREKQIQSYVEGWQQGQDYITGEYTIDELLEFDKPSRKDSEKKVPT